MAVCVCRNEWKPFPKGMVRLCSLTINDKATSKNTNILLLLQRSVNTFILTICLSAFMPKNTKKSFPHAKHIPM